jgi:uncharacterized protein
MDKNVVNWFEIPVKDLKGAKNFYSSLLGVGLQDMQMPGMEMAAFNWVQGGEYATGALVKSDNHVPSMDGTTVYFACEDVNEQLGKVEKLGGKVIVPKTSIGEFGFIAQIIDTEGNKVALHSEK